MGSNSSSNKDFNRVLARQPRKSIDIPKFRGSTDLQQQPLTSNLVIPNPVRISQTIDRSANASPISSNKLSIVNQQFEPSQTSIQSIPTSSIKPTNSSSVIDNNQTQQKPEADQSGQQIIGGSSLFSVRSDLPEHFQTMNGNPIVISRSVINTHDHRRLRHHHLSSFRPHRTIVEHNGKQFLIEFRERAERRHVRCFDETTGRMRLFEVIDYIPSRIVKPFRHKSQSVQQTGASHLKSNQRAAVPPIPSDQSASGTQSNLVNSNDLHNRDNLTGESNLQHNNFNFPVTNNTPTNISNGPSTIPSQFQSLPDPRLTRQNTTDSNYSPSQYSQLQTLDSSSIGSQKVSNQHSSKPFLAQTPSFRAHTPTDSEHSVRSSENYSTDSNEETETENDEGVDRIIKSNSQGIDYHQTNPSLFNGQKNTAVFYGGAGGNNSPTQFDAFARPIRTSDHYYRKRPIINNYSEPITNNRKFQQYAQNDYAPL